MHAPRLTVLTSKSIRDVNLELDVDEQHRKGHGEVALRPDGSMLYNFFLRLLNFAKKARAFAPGRPFQPGMTLPWEPTLKEAYVECST